MSKRTFADLSSYRLAPTERAWLERIRSEPQPVKKEPGCP